MADDPAPTFCGKYVLSLPGTAEPVFCPPLGWLVAGSDGSLMLQYDTFPLDGSGFFNCYALASGAIVFQAAASGKYLALGQPLDSYDIAINASAAEPAQALQLYALRTGLDVCTSVLLFGMNPMGFIGCSVSIYTPTFNSRSSPTAGFQSFSLMCVLPEAPIPMPPSSISALRYATETDPTRQSATSQQSAWRRAAAGRLAATSTGDPSTPYFCGKYAVTYPEGWIFRSGNAAASPPIPPSVGIAKAFPADGSGVFIGYRQPPITWDAGHQNMPAMSWQTIPGPWSPSGSAASPPAGGFLDVQSSGQNIIVNSGVPAVGQATPFCVFSPDQGPVFILGQSSSYGWYIASDDNPVLGIISDPTQWTRPLLTRLVAGLQDVLASGASNWWDGADLSYVNMTTCVGSLTGAAAQWGNANFTGAVLTNMDLRNVAIGKEVNFTNAALTGVQFKVGQDFTNATLAGADLSGVDLRAVKFGFANLTGANLTNAVLKEVDLSATTCIGTNFSSCDLTTTRLPMAPGALGQGSTGAIFVDASVCISLSDKSIHLPVLLGRDWRNFDLSAATLTSLPTTIGVITANYAKFQNTILDGLKIMPDANNNGASFQFADLTGASLRGVSLQYADFSNALLFAANLSNADLTGTKWSNAFLGTKQYLFNLSPYGRSDLATLNNSSVPADLSAAFAANNHALQNPQVTVQSDFSAWVIVDGANTYSVSAAQSALNVLIAGSRANSAQLTGACLAGANLTGGSFAGVHLNGVQLTDTANASGVDFEQADFTGANISSATPNQPNLQNAALYGAKLDGALLFYANLQGAFLTASISAQPATLRGAMLAGTTLTGAQLAGTDLTGALVGLAPQDAPSSFAPGSSGIGVPLFTLDASIYTPILNTWGSSPSAPAALQTAFAAQGISLSSPASLTPYSGHALWDISLDADGDPPPTPAQAGWIWTEFTIMQGQSQYQGTNDLVVYGTAFWMFAPDVTGALQPEPYSVAKTNLTNKDIVGSTYCPNGDTWATNKRNTVLWEAAMMPQ